MVVRLLAVVLIVALLALIDGPELVRRRRWRDLIAAAFFLVIGAGLAVVVVLGLDIYTPVDLIVDVLDFLVANLSRLW